MFAAVYVSGSASTPASVLVHNVCVCVYERAYMHTCVCACVRAERCMFA